MNDSEVIAAEDAGAYHRNTGSRHALMNLTLPVERYYCFAAD